VPEEPVEGGDDQSVSGLERGDRAVELRIGRSSAEDAVVDVKIVMSNTGRSQVLLLPVEALLFGGHGCVSDRLRHSMCF
jgi:hypothetical protein